MLIIKYEDPEKWPDLIKPIMSLRAFQIRFNLKGDGRVQIMSKAKNLPLKTVVLISEAIEEIQKERVEELKKTMGEV